MEDISYRQQLFRKLFEKLSTGSVAGQMAVSPVGDRPYGSGIAVRQGRFSKAFRNVSND
jgi:hypothetical protein